VGFQEMEAELTRGLKETKEFSKISRIKLPNNSKIYISKKGWNLVTPDGKEINIPYGEINLAIKETIEQGYTSIPPTTKDGGYPERCFMTKSLVMITEHEYDQLQNRIKRCIGNSNDEEVEDYKICVTKAGTCPLRHYSQLLDDNVCLGFMYKLTTPKRHYKGYKEE